MDGRKHRQSINLKGFLSKNAQKPRGSTLRQDDKKKDKKDDKKDAGWGDSVSECFQCFESV